MKENDIQNEEINIKKNIINIFDSEDIKTEVNEKKIFQKKVHKLNLEKEKNKLKKEINNTEKIPANKEIFEISKNFKNISYENINKYKDLLDTNRRYNDPIEINNNTQND